MTAPQTILADLWGHGITLRIAADGANLAAPAGRLSPEQRALVLAHKAELVALLHAAHQTTAALLAAAMQACDHHGDGDIARQDMRQQCMDTPPYLRGELVDHFNRTYGKQS